MLRAAGTYEFSQTTGDLFLRSRSKRVTDFRIIHYYYYYYFSFVRAAYGMVANVLDVKWACVLEIYTQVTNADWKQKAPRILNNKQKIDIWFGCEYHTNADEMLINIYDCVHRVAAGCVSVHREWYLVWINETRIGYMFCSLCSFCTDGRTIENLAEFPLPQTGRLLNC